MEVRRMFEITTIRSTGAFASSSSPVGLGMAACDAAGRLTFLSTTLRELLGTSFESADGAGPETPRHMYREDGPRLLPDDFPLARARKGEVVTDEVMCHRSEDHVVTYLRCNAAPVTAPDGTVDGAVVFIEDVTHGHLAQQGHRQLDDPFMSTLNHELRTPLTKLVGHAEMLQDLRGQLPLSALHSLEKVCEAADELCELADLVSSMADHDTLGRPTETDDEPADSSRGDSDRIPEQLAHGGLRSVPKIPQQPDAGLDPDRVIKAIGLLAKELPSYRSEA
jgi:hypothetical protein